MTRGDMMERYINALKQDWSSPRQAVHRGKVCPFLLACHFDALPANPSEMNNNPVPRVSDLREFWKISRKATLFKDEQYGQWGVEILSPEEAIEETQRKVQMRPELSPTDFIFGRFFGDPDLLLMRCDVTAGDVGSVTVVPPIDRRSEWPRVANSFGDFLQRLIRAQGDKYWEVV